MSTTDDDGDWTEIHHKPRWGKSALPVGVSIRRREWKNGKKIRSTLLFRGEAAATLEKLLLSGDSNFVRIDLGGANANKLRIRAGQPGWTNSFGVTRPRNMLRILVGEMSAWPNDERGPVKGEYEVVDDGKTMILTFPVDWAREVKALAPPVASAISSIPPSRRPAPVIGVMGEPPPGRSALDQRNRK